MGGIGKLLPLRHKGTKKKNSDGPKKKKWPRRLKDTKRNSYEKAQKARKKRKSEGKSQRSEGGRGREQKSMEPAKILREND